MVHTCTHIDKHTHYCSEFQRIQGSFFLFAKWNQGNIKLKSLVGFLAQEEPHLFFRRKPRLFPVTVPWALCHIGLGSPQATG